MSIKLIVLKSGEDIIADVKKLISEENVVGYLLQEPQRILAESIPSLSENEECKTISNLKITLTPWIPFTSDQQVPVRPDWIVTIVEPINDILKMYDEKTNGKFKTDSTNEQSDYSFED